MMKILQSNSTDIPTLLVLFYVKVKAKLNYIWIQNSLLCNRELCHALLPNSGIRKWLPNQLKYKNNHLKQ